MANVVAASGSASSGAREIEVVPDDELTEGEWLSIEAAKLRRVLFNKHDARAYNRLADLLRLLQEHYELATAEEEEFVW